MRRLLSELEGAVDRAGDAIKAEAVAEAAAGRQEQQSTDTPAYPNADGTT